MPGMSQPTPYTRATAFAEDEASNVGGRSTVRTARVDAELDAVAQTLSETLTNLELIQRDDGKLRDSTVELHTLSSAVLALLAAYGATPRGAWVTATSYAYKDLVSQTGNTYICVTAHTSGTFATDLSAGRWLLFSLGSSIGAGAVSFSPTGTISATDVQAAINESDTENRALSAAAQATASAALPTASAASTASDVLGDALLGVKKTWSGAKARTQHGVNEEVATIYDALPPGFVTTNDATTYIQAALDSGVKVVDFLGLALKCDAVTVPAGVWAKNVNFTKYTAAAGTVVLVNTGSMVTGKIAGTGLTSAIQRCIYPAADGVTDVSLNVDVSNATYGVHAQYLGTNTEANYPKRWSGYIYAHDIVGTAGVSEGYGVLLSPALACQFRVNSKTIARHAVYLSAGASDCIIDVTVDGCSNYAVQLFSNSGQPATERNTVRVKAKNLSESVAGQGGAVGIIQNAHRNTISVDLEGNNATSYAILVEGASGGPYPLANHITGCHITGQFTGADVIRCINADSTHIKGNTLHCYATNNVIALRRSGTNGITHGGYVEGNDINGQAQNVVGVYDEVNTVESYIGPNSIRNNGSSARVSDSTSGYRTGFSRRATFSGTSGSVTATSTLDVTPTINLAISTTARRTQVWLSGASVDYTKPSLILGQAPASETQAAFRIYNAHSSAQTFNFEGVVEGD